MTSVATQKQPKPKTKDSKKRKLERDDSPAEGEEKRLKSTTDVDQEAVGSVARKSQYGNGVPQHGIGGGMPVGLGVHPMYMARPPPMAHGLPPLAMQQRPGFAGYPLYGHQLPQDMPMYPSFAPTNFRVPWSMPMAYQDDGSLEYTNQDASHRQHLPMEALPARIPPPPQEVVFMKPEGRQAEEEEELSKAGEGVVVVE